MYAVLKKSNGQLVMPAMQQVHSQDVQLGSIPCLSLLRVAVGDGCRSHAATCALAVQRHASHCSLNDSLDLIHLVFTPSPHILCAAVIVILLFKGNSVVSLLCDRTSCTRTCVASGPWWPLEHMTWPSATGHSPMRRCHLLTSTSCHSSRHRSSELTSSWM